MRSHHSKGTSVVALSVLVMGFAACSSQSENKAPAWDDGDFANVEFGVGEAVTGCSLGTAGFDGTANANVLTITNFTGTVVLSAPGGVLKMNGQTCTTLDAGAGTALKVTGTGTNVVKKIVMDDQGTDDKVLLDMYAGPFTSVFAGTTGTGLTVTFTTGADAFLIRGSNAVEKVNVIQANTTDALYFDIGTTTDGKADVKVERAVVSGVGVKVSLANGADFFTAVSTGVTAYSGGNITDLGLPTGAMTIYGGDAADTITDGSGADVIYGGAGNDTIKASGVGNDSIFGGADTDMIDYGARAAAVTLTLAETSTLTMTAAGTEAETVTIDGVTYTFMDALTASPGVAGEVLIGTDNNDTLAHLMDAINVVSANDGTTHWATASAPNVTADAGATGEMVVTGKTTARVLLVEEDSAVGTWSKDALAGSAAVAALDTDRLYEFENVTGGSAADHLTGNAGVNLVYGGAGADSIYGGDGMDTIYGGNDGDSIYGGDDTAVDALYGELGDDSFFSASAADGADSVFGSNGTDTMSYAARTGAVTVTLAATTTEEVLANDIEQLIGGSGADILTCGTGACTVWGGLEADAITGGAGADYISGDGGDDVILGNGGNDLLLGEAGLDSILGGAGDDTVSGGDGNDILLAGEDGIDQVFGGAGDDTLTGGLGVDMLSGGAGNDSMNGGADAGDLCVTEETDVITANTCDIM